MHRATTRTLATLSSIAALTIASGAAAQYTTLDWQDGCDTSVHPTDPTEWGYNLTFEFEVGIEASPDDLTLRIDTNVLIRLGHSALNAPADLSRTPGVDKHVLTLTGFSDNDVEGTLIDKDGGERFENLNLHAVGEFVAGTDAEPKPKIVFSPAGSRKAFMTINWRGYTLVFWLESRDAVDLVDANLNVMPNLDDLDSHLVDIRYGASGNTLTMTITSWGKPMEFGHSSLSGNNGRRVIQASVPDETINTYTLTLTGFSTVGHIVGAMAPYNAGTNEGFPQTAMHRTGANEPDQHPRVRFVAGGNAVGYVHVEYKGRAVAFELTPRSEESDTPETP